MRRTESDKVLEERPEVVLSVEPFKEFFLDGIASGTFDEHTRRAGEARIEVWKLNIRLAEAMDTLGLLVVVTARAGAKRQLCGYNVAMISPRLDDFVLIAATSYLFVRSTSAGLSLRLVRRMAEELRLRGCVAYYLYRTRQYPGSASWRMDVLARRAGGRLEAEMYSVPLPPAAAKAA